MMMDPSPLLLREGHFPDPYRLSIEKVRLPTALFSSSPLLFFGGLKCVCRILLTNFTAADRFSFIFQLMLLALELRVSFSPSPL